MATKKQTEAAPAEQAAPEVSAAEARNELGRALRVFRAFEHADKVLAVLENAEQVIAERQQMADGALRLKDEAQAALDKVLEELAAAKEEAKAVVANAKAEAAQMLDRAKRDAVAIVREADCRAQEAAKRATDAAAREKASLDAVAAIANQLEAANQTIQRAERMREALSR